MSSSTFRLFRSTSPANRCQYVGTLITPDGRVWSLEANVSECDRAPGGPSGSAAAGKLKYFDGTVHGGIDVVRHLLRSARVEGTIPPDLIDLMAGDADVDLNDELPAEL